MKIIDKFKKAGSTVLGIAALTSAILLGSCGQKESDVQSTKPPVQSSTITSSDITDSTIDSQQPQQPTKVKATELIDDLLSTKDFENVFQNTLVSLVQKEYPYHNVTDVSVDSLTIRENGMFVLNATLESNGVVTSTQVTYSGDTSVYKDFFDYGMDKETAKKSTMRLLGVSSVTQLTIGSTFERQVIETFEEKMAQFDEQTQLIKGITAEELISKEVDSKPNEDTYVSVESIVNEAFAGIDFDADLMETVQKIFATRAPTNKLNKVYAIDFDISQDGHFTFYAENEMNSTGKIFINSFAITGNTNQYKNFLNLTSHNRDGFISEILNDYSLNANSQIVKGSDVEKNLRAELMNVANQYNDEKTAIEGILDASIELGNKQIKAKLKKIRSEHYEDILIKLGKNGMMKFKKSELTVILNNNEKKVLNRFLQRTKELNIIESVGRENSGEYAFVNRLYFTYFMIMSIRKEILLK